MQPPLLTPDELAALAADRNQTPCIGVCSTSSGADLCEGCGRTFDELCRWFDMTPEQRLAVWQRIEAADTIRNLRRRQATGR